MFSVRYELNSYMQLRRILTFGAMPHDLGNYSPVSLRRVGFDPRSFDVKFARRCKETLGQVLLRVHRIFTVSTIPKQDAQKDLRSRNGRDETKRKTQEKMERRSGKRSSSVGSEKMERGGDR